MTTLEGCPPSAWWAPAKAPAKKNTFLRDGKLPFWFLKGMKKWKYFQKCCKNEKYEASAFQNRSQNVAATLRSIFMIWWILIIFGKNHEFFEFCSNE